MMEWIKNLFSKESDVSSKRFIGITMSGWAMTMGSYYIISIQLFGGKESMTSVGILEFAIVSAVGLLAGGTAAEALKKKDSKKDE